MNCTWLILCENVVCWFGDLWCGDQLTELAENHLAGWGEFHSVSSAAWRVAWKGLLHPKTGTKEMILGFGSRYAMGLLYPGMLRACWSLESPGLGRKSCCWPWHRAWLLQGGWSVHGCGLLRGIPEPLSSTEISRAWSSVCREERSDGHPADSPLSICRMFRVGEEWIIQHNVLPTPLRSTHPNSSCLPCSVVWPELCAAWVP